MFVHLPVTTLWLELYMCYKNPLKPFFCVRLFCKNSLWDSNQIIYQNKRED